MKIAILSFDHLHATEYAAALRTAEGVELLAADPGHESRPPGEPGGPGLAAELGVAYAEDYEAVWRWRPDAVVICSENRGHRELVLRAAAEGVHILCEKPIGIRSDEAAEMVAAAEAAGVVLMTAFPVRFSPAYAELRSTVRSGLLGQIVSIAATNCGGLPIGLRSWFVDRERSGGGAITDHVVHVADLLADLLGAAPEDVYAVANSLPQGGAIPVETGALLSLRYPEGVIASIDCSWSKPKGVPDSGDLVTLTVIGTDGVAEISPFAGVTSGWSAASGPITLSHVVPLDEMLIATFLDAVRRETRGTEPSGRAGLRAVEVVDAAYRSLRSGEPERVGA
ncbi:Gfo/Idh/MocA family protein [Agromyces mediolanus]|uniref:Gfo/Idh/MocA family protein n=1 Tax=Agromyces mediolanus TaxID=41986 RepID=UPI001E2C4CDF|nr:Gfo/Idh/MocA family oxidoreductase [Agromyces mediolanus]MCD1570571.1 Gfo/Idh/MocA family oxidoreductase [Agromyces mediolanus]